MATTNKLSRNEVSAMRTTTRWIYLASFFCVLVVASCSRSSQQYAVKPARFPTKGSLTYNGQPAKGALVTFWPQSYKPDAKDAWRTVKPAATVTADGSFEVSSYDMKDGAMAGDYALTVVWNDEGASASEDYLRGRFADPKRPVATISIAKGENRVPPIKLTGPPIDFESFRNADLGR
jgi:hypothetical protein